MTQHLETLKGILQYEFTKTHTSEDYVEAISDGVYSCQYETANPLKEWIGAWVTNEPCKSKGDLEYKQGVQFVAEQWDKIMSEDKGEE